MRKILSRGNGIAMLFTLLCAYQSSAQKTPQQIQEMKSRVLSDPQVKSLKISEERQTPSLVTLKHGAASYSKIQAKPVLEKYLNIRNGIDNLIADKETRASATIEVVEFQQYYKGVKVDYAKYKAFIVNGKVAFYNGAFYDVPANLQVQPRINKAAALDRAKGTVNAKKFAWEHVQDALSKTTNPAAKKALQEELNEYLPEGELVVIKDFTNEGVAQMRLAYKFDIYSFEPISRAYVYVDAEDGRILLRDAIIKHANDNPSPASLSTSTTVQTRYSGVRPILTKQVSGNDPNSGLLLQASNPTESYSPGAATYVLVDDTRGKGVETYDLNGVGGLPLSLGPAYAAAKSFTDVDNNWTLAEHKRGGTNLESENDDIAWDAHWGAGVVYDYWKMKQDRLSFDGKDAKIKSYIHSGIGYDNAFWNGRVMTYGDGSYNPPAKTTGFRPLTSLDVCAHEIGHGVCTFTANLVYAKESGAMNEGFSDIWAACAEYFAIRTVDPELKSLYKPFSIGEQIAVDPAVPLRRMDNPQARRHPDTYGGTFWRNPNCSPTLANDYCGVHTNSGVLNKWFYLMTVGSGKGSGPDAAYAGEDDGINDKGNVYSVTGVGFDVAERVAYLTELMMSSTATFAEARELSIQVAAALSGNPCSALVKTITDAWYAVGVGEAFVQPCTITYGFVYQPGAHTSEGFGGDGCAAEHAVSVPIFLPPNSTASITVSGTAGSPADYRLSTTTLSNTTSNPRQDSVVVYVKNDGIVEGNETVVMNLTVTNAESNPVNSSYTLTIVDDDVTPVIGNGVITLLNETFTRADGFADPAGWKETLEVPEEPNGTQAAKGKNQWGVFGNKLAITGRDEITGTQLPNGTYNIHSISQTVIGSSLIDARGLSNLQLKFDYEIQGEIDPDGTDPDRWPAYDYMAIVYSFDGSTWFELSQAPYERFASAEPESGNFDHHLPSFLDNKQFYLGFRWYNDPLIGGPLSVSVDNLTLKGSPRRIENELNHNGRETVNAGQDVYVYSKQDGEILGRVKNNSNKNAGCTQLFIEKAGTGAFNLYQGRDAVHKVADKILRIEPSTASKTSNTVTLYFTEDQLAALESATGRKRTEFFVYVVNAASYTKADGKNTGKYTPTFTPISGIGGYYTVTFSDYVSGSYAIGYPVTVFTSQNAVTSSEPNMIADHQKFAVLYPNPGNGSFSLQINSPESRRVSIEVVNHNGQILQVKQMNIAAGLSSLPMNIRNVSNGTYMIRVKDQSGRVLSIHTYLKN